MVMANAALFTLIAIAKIAMEGYSGEPLQFALNALQLALAVGAVFSLAAISFGQSRLNTPRAFLTSNLLGLFVTLGAFLLLYFGGQSTWQSVPGDPNARIYLSAIAGARAGVFMLICFLAFLLIAAENETQTETHNDFASASFMALKAFFIALVYGLVVFGGAAAIFGAVRALLYQELSFKILGYLGALSAFFAFAIFIGYFPDFRKGAEDPQRDIAQKQTRFVTILFEYILVPIFLALTVVLILWAGRTVLLGVDIPFLNLYGIATSYAVGGLVLHILVTHGESAPAKLYLRIFPLAVLVILLFEAWALVISLLDHGLQMEEYLFIVTWFITFCSAILLLIRQNQAHRPIVYVVSLLAALAVMPVIGFHQLPYNQQVGRLEKLLRQENMLESPDGGASLEIVPAVGTPALATREGITNAVDFLIYQDNDGPSWLAKDALRRGSFERIFGFAPVYSGEVDPGQKDRFTQLRLNTNVIDVSGYQWELAALLPFKASPNGFELEGDNGRYVIRWQDPGPAGTPALTVSLDGREILNRDAQEFLDEILLKFPLGAQTFAPPTLQDMTWTLETPEIQMTLIFEEVYISEAADSGVMSSYLTILTAYLTEK